MEVLPDLQTSGRNSVNHGSIPEAERRAAMIASGWSPDQLAALEEAMEPKFLRDMKKEQLQ